MDMRRKTRSRPPAKVPSSAQPSTPTVRPAEQQTKRERGIGVWFQRAGAAARTSRPQHTGPDVQPTTAAAVQASGDTMTADGHASPVPQLCCAASAPQHTAGLPWAGAAQPRRGVKPRRNSVKPRRNRGVTRLRGV
jgi:hypothetical protein